MPLVSLHYPSLALGLLAQYAAGAGWRVREHYFAFDFAERIGLDAYMMIADERHYQALLGEWIFAGLVHPRPEADAFGYLSEALLDGAAGLRGLVLTQAALGARAAAPAFVDACADAIAAEAPAVVGITSSFQQNMGSLALVRALRTRLPDAWLVMGGANCEGPLGRALMAAHPELDAVCIGEGDHAFPAFLAAAADRADPPHVRGMLTRAKPEAEMPPRLVMDMDGLPVPDYDTFFERFHAVPGLSEILTPAPVIETSRGCWWGAKHHCTFCGLNGGGMAFRAKSPDRAFAEFSAQADRHGTDIVVVDNILDYRYFDTLLPRLADDPRPFLMHYEVKANLTPRMVAVLARAGVRKIQPGLETLDTGILKLMRKGVTAIQNVQTLKLCAEAGIYVEWCFLHGFPGERAAAYAEIAALVPLLHHLQPPGSVGPVRADRFSPYFETPEAFGISVRPAPAYAHLIDGPPEAVAAAAYHFEIDEGDPGAAADRAAPAIAALADWRRRARPATLAVDGRVVADTRGPAPLSHRLSACEARVVEICATVCGEATLGERIGREFGPGALGPAMERLRRLGLVMEERAAYLALPLRQPGFVSAPRWEDIRRAPDASFAARRPHLFVPAAAQAPAATRN